MKTMKMPAHTFRLGELSDEEVFSHHGSLALYAARQAEMASWRMYLWAYSELIAAEHNDATRWGTYDVRVVLGPFPPEGAPVRISPEAQYLVVPIRGAHR